MEDFLFSSDPAGVAWDYQWHCADFCKSPWGIRCDAHDCGQYSRQDPDGPYCDLFCSGIWKNCRSEPACAIDDSVQLCFNLCFEHMVEKKKLYWKAGVRNPMGVYLKIRKKLEHFSIDIEQEYDQGVLVIQGESGAGRTTVLNCISGLLTPDQGRIVLGERTLYDDGQKINVLARQRNIGYVFQNYALFPNLSL